MSDLPSVCFSDLGDDNKHAAIHRKLDLLSKKVCASRASKLQALEKGYELYYSETPCRKCLNHIYLVGCRGRCSHCVIRSMLKNR